MADAFTFENLWKQHPEIASDGKPCKNGNNKGQAFTNQCAINMGVAFTECGVNTRKWGIDHCNRARFEEEHRGHVLRAENFANALRKHGNIKGLGSLQKIKPEDFDLSVTGKTGIIFFKDYWRREDSGVKETFANRSGDHIDLWNGSRLTDWFTWIRIQAGFSWEGSFSDYSKSKEVWFWQVL